jgi:Ca2+-binding RTX toxin-like protein
LGYREGVIVAGHLGDRRGVLGSALAAAVLLVAVLFAMASVSETADARKIKGTGAADTLTGTKKKDRIKGKGGNDTLTGREGKDVLAGGSGDDLIDAVDNARDKKVKGGSGTNTCRLDQADLTIAKGCSTIQTPGGSGGGAGGGGGAEAAGGGLSVTSASGLTCGSSLPTCVFQINGTGADADVGTVTGTQGVTGIGGAVSLQSDGSWQAGGTYGCTGPGFLHVEIGSKFVDVPVTCTTA